MTRSRPKEPFLDCLAELARELQAATALRLSDPHQGPDLRVVSDAVALATGKALTDVEFAELYGQTLACIAAVTAMASEGIGRPSARRWLAAQDHPLWQAVLADGQSPLVQAAAARLDDIAGSGLPVAAFARTRSPGPPDRTPASAATDLQAPSVDEFFERFLHRHDARKRARHGVYYTPQALAAYLVASVDRFLVEEFGLPDGLADISTWHEVESRQPGLRRPPGVRPDEPFVTVLDPAVGTGIFLVEAIDCIYRRLQAKWIAAGCDQAERTGRWNVYVPQHLLPRLHGFELMLPAGAIAILRVAAKLSETGFTFDTPGSVQVRLLNTLAGPPPARTLWEPAASGLLSAVRADREACCDRPCTVVLGNPPFSGISRESGTWISRLLKGCAASGTKVANYYEIDGRPLGERKHWLQDDYVKFLRFAHWKIELAGCGLIGLITNHGYLDNPTFRGLRQQLLRDFPRITVLDLHGNRKKQERPPDGQADENVFGIDTGIAFSFLRRPPGQVNSDAVKESGIGFQPVMFAEGHDRLEAYPTGCIHTLSAEVSHAELWGPAAAKLAWLRSAAHTTTVDNPATLATRSLIPPGPYYTFTPQDDSPVDEYLCARSLAEIMPLHVTAPVTARDRFVVAFDGQELLERLREFRDRTIPDDAIRTRYFTRTRSAVHPPGDTRGWRLAEARQRLADDPQWADHVQPCWYRPFDRRVIYWTEVMIDWPRREVTDHLLAGPNLALIARRQMLPSQPCNFFWVADTLAADGVIRSDNRGSESLFPLYRYSLAAGTWQRRANFADDFVADVAQRLALRWQPAGRGDLATAFGPEDLLAYCYALLFCPQYRERYAGLLRREFPRILVPRNAALFRDMSGLGAGLIERHLLRRTEVSPAGRWAGPAIGAGREGVVRAGFPKYVAERVFLDQDTWLGPVSAEVWQYHVGGHQVCRKWWSDRRGRRWTQEQIATYCRVVSALEDTLRLAREIDAAIDGHGGWPAAFEDR